MRFLSLIVITLLSIAAGCNHKVADSTAGPSSATKQTVKKALAEALSSAKAGDQNLFVHFGSPS